MIFNIVGPSMTMLEIYDLNSAEGIKRIVTALFTGYNYRLYTEGQTRTQLLQAYLYILKIYERIQKISDDDEAEIEDVYQEIEEADRDLALWLLGLTHKTAQNLGVRKTDRLDYLREVIAHVKRFTDENPQLPQDTALLMLWAGASTLTVRGSRKSTAGKTLEQAFVRAGLTLLGLQEERDFWLNMQRDEEVGREIDVEILSNRGRIKMEIGLIGQGNQEVIEDKINRVGAGGMVIFDQLGPRSNAWETARRERVCFVQIRNNRPLTQMYEFLKSKVTGTLEIPPSTPSDIEKAVNELPNHLFVT